MIRFLLDANIVVYALSGRFPSMRRRFEVCMPGEIGLSAVTMAEVAVGIARGKPPEPGDLERLLATTPILPFDEAAARTYAMLPFRRARFDRLLAAHALSINAAVVTNNETDFADVPRLKLENWTL